MREMKFGYCVDTIQMDNQKSAQSIYYTPYARTVQSGQVAI